MPPKPDQRMAPLGGPSPDRTHGESWGLEGKARARFSQQARELGLPEGRPHEAFTVTAWGVVPDAGQLEWTFPTSSQMPDAACDSANSWGVGAVEGQPEGWTTNGEGSSFPRRRLPKG